MSIDVIIYLDSTGLFECIFLNFKKLRIRRSIPTGKTKKINGLWSQARCGFSINNSI